MAIAITYHYQKTGSYLNLAEDLKSNSAADFHFTRTVAFSTYQLVQVTYRAGTEFFYHEYRRYQSNPTRS